MARQEMTEVEAGIQPSERARGVLPSLLMLGAGVAGTAALALVVSGWLAFGETIYLTQLTAFVAGCF